MEDRIVANLTPIQFALLVVGGLSAFMIFGSTSLPTPLNRILGGFLGMITVTLALGKFNDQPLYRFFRHIWHYVVSPKTRVWRKAGPEAVLVKNNPSLLNQQEVRTVKQVSKADISRLAAVLDSRGAVGKPSKVVIERKLTNK